jgi:hypothetical protein
MSRRPWAFVSRQAGPYRGNRSDAAASRAGKTGALGIYANPGSPIAANRTEELGGR